MRSKPKVIRDWNIAFLYWHWKFHFFVNLAMASLHLPQNVLRITKYTLNTIPNETRWYTKNCWLWWKMPMWVNPRGYVTWFVYTVKAFYLRYNNGNFHYCKTWWRQGVAVVTRAHLNSTKLKFSFCTVSNPTHSMSCHKFVMENFWQWSRLEIRLNTFRQSTIP